MPRSMASTMGPSKADRGVRPRTGRMCDWMSASYFARVSWRSLDLT